MKAHEYILTKQTQWAKSHGISLIGSKGERGRPAYTRNLEGNLFEPLLPEVRGCFLGGDGNEILGYPDSPAKMQAVHSSSALGINIFHHWHRIGQASFIAAACGLCRKGNVNSFMITFEKKFTIDPKFPHPPNIDVVFQPSDSSKCRTFAVECKFTEPYGSQGHGGLKPKYMAQDSLWADIPNMHALARSICPMDSRFSFFHAAQIIKHILGSRRRSGRPGSDSSTCGTTCQEGKRSLTGMRLKPLLRSRKPMA